MAGPFVAGGTALVVTVAEWAQVLAPVRDRYDPSVSFGVPPHVTVLFPWLRQQEVDDSTRRAVREIAGRQPCFDAALVGIGRFPGVAWLAPEPAAPFVALTRAVSRRWPQASPYGGVFGTPIPHLTVADGQPDEVLDDADGALAPLLPLPFRVDALDLLGFDGTGWRPLDRFALGGAG